MDEESRRVVITVTLRKRGPERVEADALHVALTDAQPVDSQAPAHALRIPWKGARACSARLRRLWPGLTGRAPQEAFGFRRLGGG